MLKCTSQNNTTNSISSFSAAFVHQPAIVLASAGTESYLSHSTPANIPSYSAIHRSSQQYTQQILQRSHQQQQSSNINMLDFRSPFVAPAASGEQSEQTTYPPPTFDFGMPRNITARSGQTAAINCRVEYLGDKSVSLMSGSWFEYIGI